MFCVSRVDVLLGEYKVDGCVGEMKSEMRGKMVGIHPSVLKTLVYPVLSSVLCPLPLPID